MRHRRWLVLILAATVVLAGCSADTTVVATPQHVGISGDAPPNDVTWIQPAEAWIGNYNMGDNAEYVIEVHNGKPIPVVFDVTVRQPDNLRSGYYAAEQLANFVVVSPAELSVGPMQTGIVAVVVSTPKDYKYQHEHWEYWVSIIDTTDIGMIRRELCSRGMVAMAE